MKPRSIDPNTLPFKTQFVIIVVIQLLYIALRFTLNRFIANPLLQNPLALLPIIGTAWLFGLRGGLSSSLLVLMMGTVVLNLGREDRSLTILFVENGVLGPVALVIVGAMVGYMRDLGRRVQQELTNRMQAEEALRDSREQYRQMAESALEANRFKSELLAKVSHELRTPLGVILGRAEIIESNIYGPTNEQQNEMLDEIIDSTHYLTRLVSDLLFQTKIEQGVFEFEQRPFSPQALLEKVAAQMESSAAVKALTMSFTIADCLPATILGDEARVQQIMVHLINNGIKFTAEGEVAVSLFCPNEQQWAIQVKDSGMGIAAAAQEQIFEPFWQVDGSKTRTQKGTGLGLSLVKQLTTMMDGEIIVDSTLGRGSTFTVILPLSAVNSAAHT